MPIDDWHPLIAERNSSAPAAAMPSLTIVATSGTGGDVLPFITMAKGLVEQGHRVLMLIPGLQESTVQESGLPYRTFGSLAQGLAQLEDPDLWDERKGWGVIWRGLTPNLGALRELVQSLPANDSCVVLCHPILVPMAALARSVRPDLRIVAAYLAPSNLCSSHDMLAAGSLRIPAWAPLAGLRALWRLIHHHWIDPVTLPSLNALRRQFNLPEVPHFFAHVLAAPDASIGLFPRWFAAVQADWPQPFVEGAFVRTTAESGGSLPIEVERFLSEGEPPIVFTPGTGHQHAAFYFETALKTLKRLGRRGLFLTPHVGQVPDQLPASVMWLAHVPFADLLPRTAALVHHGGIGTCAEAFRAGIPQLIVPFAYDQFDNGFRAKRLGVADVLLAKRLSAGRMRRQLAHLLASQRVKAACNRVATSMAEGPAQRWLLDQIAEWLRDR